MQVRTDIYMTEDTANTCQQVKRKHTFITLACIKLLLTIIMILEMLTKDSYTVFWLLADIFLPRPHGLDDVS